MAKEGWYEDPADRHEYRWFSEGTPTDLVKDGTVTSRDPISITDPAAFGSMDLEQPPNLTPSDANDMMRADEATRTSFFDEEPGGTAQKPAKKPWWQATTSVLFGFVMAALLLGAGVGWLIASLLPPHDGRPPHDIWTRVLAVTWLVSGTWYAASVVVVLRRARGAAGAARASAARRGASRS